VTKIKKRVILQLLLLIVVSQNVSASTITASYDLSTQVLTIPKLGVASGDAGYAYQVNMTLFSLDPIGFVVADLNLTGAITPDKELSAVYIAESHSIYFPTVFIINEDGTQIELKKISIRLGADPFVWFYFP